MQFRGYAVYRGDDGDMYFSDTDEPTATTWEQRPCGNCHKMNTPEGHDGCLGTIPGVMNACCGHGEVAEAYVQFYAGVIIPGHQAVAWLQECIKRRLPMKVFTKQKGRLMPWVEVEDTAEVSIDLGPGVTGQLDLFQLPDGTLRIISKGPVRIQLDTLGLTFPESVVDL